MMRNKADKLTCPKCGSRKIAAVRYGKQAMTPALEAAIERGEIVLGGCGQQERPGWYCHQCQWRWN